MTLPSAPRSTLMVVEDDTARTMDDAERDRDLVALEDAEHELADLEAELGGADDATAT